MVCQLEKIADRHVPYRLAVYNGCNAKLEDEARQMGPQLFDGRGNK
jgi:hypothetical protein